MKRWPLILVSSLAAFGAQADPLPCWKIGAVPGQCIPVDVSATAGQWAIVRLSDSVIVVRDRSWIGSDGQMPPDWDYNYAYVHQVSIPPLDYDSRLQDLIPTEVLSMPAQTLITTWTTPLRDEASLKLAIDNIAAQKINDFMVAQGIQDPADFLDIIALLSARLDGQTLPAADQARLKSFSDISRTYVPAVKSYSMNLKKWINEHPGVAPALTGWPELPE